MEKIIDARKMACPLPVVNAKKAAEEMNEGDVLKVIADNETAVSNLKRFAGYRGFEVTGEKTGKDEYLVTMKISGSGISSESDIETVCAPAMDDMLVVLSSDTMGTGDEKLGRTLMKAFIFALTKQDRMPSGILCYNRGAFLTCEGSESIEDLKILADEGVEILTCGTCLDYYGLREKLSIGSVTNMYDIVDMMETAGKIVRP